MYFTQPEESPLNRGDVPSFELCRRDVMRSVNPPTGSGPILTPEQIDRYRLGNELNTVITRALEFALVFMRGFICQPHIHLGRDGPVCPFTEKGLRENLIRFSAYLGDPGSEAIKIEMRSLIGDFMSFSEKQGAKGIFASTVMVFPEMSEQEFLLIDQVQGELKREAVREGLMIGQFHPLCNQGGVQNSEFRPLRSPLGMLAIRHMVPGDLLFLYDDPDYRAAYLKRFSREAVPPGLRKLFDQAVQRHQA